MNPAPYDVAIVGAGILGLATAMQLSERYPGLALVVLEKERRIAQHQTGHNSGVIHSGLYYRPGTAKAEMALRGAEELIAFCQQHGLPHERCGKVVVATEASQLPALEELERRGRANGVPGIRGLGPEALRELEPYATGLRALHVPSTGIVDYGAVAAKYREIVEQRGGEIRLNARLTGLHPTPSALRLRTPAGPIEARYLINCAGLQADRVSRLAGQRPPVQIVPFRGEYYELRPERRGLVKNLIYPVPDPAFPFLGVHFSRRVDGRVEAGPNAVLALRREGYRWRDVSPRDTWETLRYRGFRRLARRYWRTGLGEMHRSLRKPAFVAALRVLLPSIEDDDLVPGGTGVRAQALEPDGTLADDFRIVQDDRMIHVLNAPSPGATASISIGRAITDLTAAWFGQARSESAP